MRGFFLMYAGSDVGLRKNVCYTNFIITILFSIDCLRRWTECRFGFWLRMMILRCAR